MEGDENNDWNVTLLRALVNGDLEITKRDVMLHLEALTHRFTQDMEQWKIEWESIHWWQLLSASSVFVASLYSHPHILRWLLEHGADRHLKCYLGQTALDMVGECSNDAKKTEECRWLLKDTARPSSPPTKLIIQPHLSIEQVARRMQVPIETEDGNIKVVERTVQQEVHKCTLHIFWNTPLSNGSMIEKYEIRYRPEALGQKSKQRGWRMDSCLHARIRQQQGLTISNLLPNTSYELSGRSTNGAGRGEWGESLIIHTPSIGDKNGGHLKENQVEE